jgi:hypothetical protein
MEVKHQIHSEDGHTKHQARTVLVAGRRGEPMYCRLGKAQEQDREVSLASSDKIAESVELGGSGAF